MPALLVVLGIGAPCAAAGSDDGLVTQVVPAILDVQNVQNPSDPGNCSAVAFIRWRNVAETVSAKVSYRVATSGAPRSESAQKSVPFDDSYELVGFYRVPVGYHWIAIGSSHRDGPTPDDCSAAAERLRSVILPPLKVELTVREDAPPVIRRAAPSRTTKSVGNWTVKLGTVTCPRRGSCSVSVLSERPIKVIVGGKVLRFAVTAPARVPGGKTRPITARLMNTRSVVLRKRITLRVKVKAQNGNAIRTSTLVHGVTFVPRGG